MKGSATGKEHMMGVYPHIRERRSVCEGFWFWHSHTLQLFFPPLQPLLPNLLYQMRSHSLTLMCHSSGIVPGPCFLSPYNPSPGNISRVIFHLHTHTTFSEKTSAWACLPSSRPVDPVDPCLLSVSACMSYCLLFSRWVMSDSSWLHVLHHLLKFAQIHVRWVSDAI